MKRILNAVLIVAFTGTLIASIYLLFISNDSLFTRVDHAFDGFKAALRF
ncbi:MAG: hypothetical protein IT221_08115 [Fluviicola sp.]|nr:hypothetical protein [Fluviicola sp.]